MATTIQENLIVPRQELEVQSFVKGGSSGAVFQGIWQGKGLNTPVAVKMIRNDRRELINQLCSDLSSLSSIKFRNICQVFGACRINANEVWLILEYVNGDNLHDFLFTTGPLSYEQQIRFSLQAAKALSNLHRSSIIHRDVKARSFLVKNKKELLLTDFGLCGVKDATAEVRNQRWAAPEVMSDTKQWSEKSDVYSLGMVFYEICTSQIPFHELKTSEKLKKHVKKGKRPKIPKDCPKEFANIIRECWDPIPSKRPSVDQVVDLLSNLDGISHSFHPMHLTFDIRRDTAIPKSN